MKNHICLTHFLLLCSLAQSDIDNVESDSNMKGSLAFVESITGDDMLYIGGYEGKYILENNIRGDEKLLIPFLEGYLKSSFAKIKKF